MVMGVPLFSKPNSHNVNPNFHNTNLNSPNSWRCHRVSHYNLSFISFGCFLLVFNVSNFAMMVFTLGAQEMHLELNFFNLLFLFVGETMVKYTKTFDKQISSLKRGSFFMKIQESIFKFYLDFILKLLSPQLSLL